MNFTPLGSLRLDSISGNVQKQFLQQRLSCKSPILQASLSIISNLSPREAVISYLGDRESGTVKGYQIPQTNNSDLGHGINFTVPKRKKVSILEETAILK